MTVKTTSNGYPYPDGDDPVNNGDNVIHQLAEALPPRLAMQGSGGAGSSYTTGSTGGVLVSYTTPFDAVPRIVSLFAISTALVLTLDNTNDAGGVSATRFRFTAFRIADGTVWANKTVGVNWAALGVVRPSLTTRKQLPAADDVTRRLPGEPVYSDWVACTNTGCAEYGIPKDAAGFDVRTIVCGECGQPVQPIEAP